MSKSGQSPDDIRPKSAIQQQQETEEEKRQNNTTLPVKPEVETQMRKVLYKKGISPDSPRGEYCIAHALKKATDNPVGYLVTTLRDSPNFGSEHAHPVEERGGRPMSLKEILTQAAARTSRDGSNA